MASYFVPQYTVFLKELCNTSPVLTYRPLQFSVKKLKADGFSLL